MSRAPVAVLGVGLALAALAGAAHAHESRPLYVEIEEREVGVYEVRWRAASSLPGADAVEARLAAPCEPVAPPVTIAEPAARAVVRAWRCDTAGARSVEIRWPEWNPSTPALVRVVRASGEVRTAVLGPDEARWVVPERETRAGVARDYTLLGVRHILEGLDHLLFLACLVLLARGFRRLLVTITGFTLAHSVTLALAALDLVRIPVAPVEAAIALSVLFVASELARGRRDSLTWRYPLAVSSSFGLLHGFGFAAVLGETGLPQTEIPVALACFNLGVEIGQVFFVATLLAAAALARRLRWIEPDAWPQLERAAVYAVGCTAAFWTLARLAAFAM